MDATNRLRTIVICTASTSTYLGWVPDGLRQRARSVWIGGNQPAARLRFGKTSSNCVGIPLAFGNRLDVAGGPGRYRVRRDVYDGPLDLRSVHQAFRGKVSVRMVD
jgi:hypothetical protein